MVTSDLDAVVAQFQEALGRFFDGDPGPCKALMSRGDDVTLANLAVEALTDADLDVDGLLARCVDGTVYVTGFAYSAADRDRATDVAQQVPGVARVENQIDSMNRVADFLKKYVPVPDCGCSLE